jgi:Rod binding domain-containing protein
MTKRLAVALSAIAGFGIASMALAQAPQQQPQQGQTAATPSGWSYTIKDGKRVPKGNRVVNADGSWREEIRQGKCLTVKEKSAAGEYKETRSCDN